MKDLGCSSGSATGFLGGPVQASVLNFGPQFLLLLNNDL